MTLEHYREKRHFDQTPEPTGNELPAIDRLRFVVQKHRATNLHYDFRLEWGGALKSWAVPKGPSMRPGEKRLAMLVEDHPLDYRTFEGIIPKGNYGAGTVMVWDEGTYRPRYPSSGQGNLREEDEQRMQAAFEKGDVKFVLEGTKLRGEFALVKLQRGEPNAWLLFKKKDEFAGTDDVRDQDRSALTGRTMDEITREAAPPEPHATVDSAGQPASKALAGDGGEPRLKAGTFVRPMLAETASEPFDRAGWLFEIKWDGYRAIAECDGSEVRLYSRTQLPFEKRYPSIVRSLARLQRRAILDGEIVVLDDEGKARFQLLQQWEHSGKGTLVYYVFDLLALDGRDLQGQPLRQRKEMLREILPTLPNLRYSDHVEEHGTQLFAAAMGKGLEGVLAKYGESTYRQGRRSPDWLKLKAQIRQDAVIGGFTQPRGSRQNIGALVLGVYDGEDLIYVGHTGTGFSARTLSGLQTMLNPLVRSSSPFVAEPSTNAPVTWVEPEVVCAVTFKEWTGDGVMRMPVFVGLRDDVPARSVVRERKQTPEVAEKRRTFTLLKSSDEEMSIGGRPVKLTNLSKVYWPEERYTKRHLIDYYRTIAPVMLPYLRDRPESLHRHPNGITGESFFHKDMRQQMPDWIRTVDLRSDSEDREISYLLCQEEATLVYMANMGCIEINPWNSRIETLTWPDYLVIDLDPEAVSFQRVVETALIVRDVLEWAGVESVCKTSGATGLHVYIPLGARYDYDQAQRLGELIARLAHARIPEWTSLERSPARRQGKVYLDYLQNRRGQTLAAPYSVRPRLGATVSTPLRWDEVQPDLDPTHFTISTILQRLETVGDLWKPVLGEGIDVGQVLERVAGGG